MATSERMADGAPVAGGGVDVLAVLARHEALAVMATPDRIEPRHRQELCDAIARCEMPRDPRIAALAQVSP